MTPTTGERALWYHQLGRHYCRKVGLIATCVANNSAGLWNYWFLYQIKEKSDDECKRKKPICSQIKVANTNIGFFEIRSDVVKMVEATSVSDVFSKMRLNVAPDTKLWLLIASTANFIAAIPPATSAKSSAVGDRVAGSGSRIPILMTVLLVDTAVLEVLLGMAMTRGTSTTAMSTSNQKFTAVVERVRGSSTDTMVMTVPTFRGTRPYFALETDEVNQRVYQIK